MDPFVNGSQLVINKYQGVYLRKYGIFFTLRALRYSLPMLPSERVTV